MFNVLTDNVKRIIEEIAREIKSLKQMQASPAYDFSNYVVTSVNSTALSLIRNFSGQENSNKNFTTFDLVKSDAPDWAVNSFRTTVTNNTQKTFPDDPVPYYKGIPAFNLKFWAKHSGSDIPASYNATVSLRFYDANRVPFTSRYTPKYKFRIGSTISHGDDLIVVAPSDTGAVRNFISSEYTKQDFAILIMDSANSSYSNRVLTTFTKDQHAVSESLIQMYTSNLKPGERIYTGSTLGIAPYTGSGAVVDKKYPLGKLTDEWKEYSIALNSATDFPEGARYFDFVVDFTDVSNNGAFFFNFAAPRLSINWG